MLQPVFIVGSGRTGSTLLYRLLDRHPRIALTNEGHVADFLDFCLRFAELPQKQAEKFILHFPTKLHGLIRKDCIPAFTKVFGAHLPTILEDFYRERFADREFTHWGDKLPAPEVGVKLQNLYPHAKYIVLVRDPRAICSSLFAMSNKDLPAADLLRSTSLETWTSTFRNEYAAFDKYLTHQITVRYEDLVRDFRGEADRILGFFGLDGLEEMLADFAALPDIKTHPTTESVEHSLVAWKGRLSAEQIAEIESSCSELMQRFGYEPIG